MPKIEFSIIFIGILNIKCAVLPFSSKVIFMFHCAFILCNEFTGFDFTGFEFTGFDLSWSEFTVLPLKFILMLKIEFSLIFIGILNIKCAVLPFSSKVIFMFHCAFILCNEFTGFDFTGFEFTGFDLSWSEFTVLPLLNLS